ncbi:pentatricopeptide repeat-containing protein At5g14080 [Lycium barbarum]|uniref:pentatricopeptide repeat-containing protein At5g14080 n=1 Tax=Lycium barbarum TaxID=112863 RepID=UPI00293E7F85|nr:pentatricopeptide repeat-containing protein At5g14080 [Lycium barbarum]
MMKRSVGEFASVISGALIDASKQSTRTQTWTPALEQTLHHLRCRESLSPTLVAKVIDPFLVNHHSLALGFFNWASQQPGFSHDSSTYHSILKTLCITRQFNTLDKLFKQVKAQKIRLHPSLYRSVIASQIIGKKSNLAFSIFSEVPSLASEIGSQTCNSLLAALSSEGNYKCAFQVFDEMNHRGVRLNTLGFGVFLWRLCSFNGLEKSLGLLDEVRKIDFSGINGSVLAVLVVHGLCSGSRIAEAVSAFDELRIRECKPDFIAYRVVAEALGNMRSVVDKDLVLKKKRKLGVAPRNNDYKEFIFDLISEKLIIEAKDLGKVIACGNFPMDDDLLHALIGSVSVIDPELAIFFLNFMLGKEMVPDLVAVTSLSANLCKHGKIDELLEVFQNLSSRNYFSHTHSYNIMVSFLCKAGKVREAYEVLRDMRRKGAIPDIQSYNLLLEACCQEDLLRPAKRLWDEMFTNGCPGNLETYNILIQKCSEEGEIEDAYRLFHDMIEKGVVPDAITYISVLKGLCQAKDLKMSLEVFDKCAMQNPTLARSVLRTFILSLCKEGYLVPAMELLRDQSTDIAILDSHLILLKFLADAEAISLAVEHLKWIQGKSPMMHQALSNEILASISSSSKPDPILKLFQLMQENRLNITNDLGKEMAYR